MVDIAALMSGLPVSELEPDRVAFIEGLIDIPEGQIAQERIVLLEPPAGQRVLYIDPLDALEKLLRHQGNSREDAQAHARDAVNPMRAEVADERWVNFFDLLNPDSPECLPVPDFLLWLRNEQNQLNYLIVTPTLREEAFGAPDKRHPLVSSDLLDFLEQAARVAASAPALQGLKKWSEAWARDTVPAIPAPHAMIEFMSGAPWMILGYRGEQWENGHPHALWREAIRPVALELEKVLGKPVYYYADPNCEHGPDCDCNCGCADDDLHRFLFLHWCCTYQPESAYVRYLVRISQARGVEALKAALVDPENYTQPFDLGHSVSANTPCCRFQYLPADKERTVAVMFRTVQARDAAQWLLLQKINAHALILAPKTLATEEWVTQTTQYCRSWCIHYLTEETGLERPFHVLAEVDEMHVIANECSPGQPFELKLSEDAEDLLWLALELGIDAHYRDVFGRVLCNPQTLLKQSGAPARCRTQSRMPNRS